MIPIELKQHMASSHDMDSRLVELTARLHIESHPGEDLQTAMDEIHIDRHVFEGILAMNAIEAVEDEARRRMKN